MERPSWAPEDVDLDRPSVARVYDYYLGGSHNFAADRAFAEQVLESMPHARTAAYENRAFLRRAVTYLGKQGIRQFIDLGSGIPTAGNVHELAPAGSKVVYVDLDPVAVAHSRAILEGVANTAVINGDLRKPADVLAHPMLRAVIDFREPIAFMLVAVLHFVTDEERPVEIVAGYAASSVPGSHVVISHGGLPTDRELTEGEQRGLALYQRSPTPVVLRSRDEVEDLFGDLTIVEPGILPPALWRADEPIDDVQPAPVGAGGEPTFGSAAIGRKD